MIRNLSEVANTLHKHVVRIGGDPPSPQNETGNLGDSGSDLDQIEQLCSSVMTLCTFVESVSTSQHDRMKKERLELLKINMERTQEIADLDQIINGDPKKEHAHETIKRLRKRCDDLQKTSTKEIERLTNSLAKVTAEKDYWINRMSSMAGKKLRDNNPEVIDLSDPNRPLKLADKFSELYDNQWTSASEHLHTTCQMSEETAIQHLSSLTKECYSSCYEKARRQLQYLHKIVLTGTWEDDIEACDSKPDSDKAPPVPQKSSSAAGMKTLKDTRNEFAHIAKERVIKDLLPVLIKSSGSELEVTSMTQYLSECISLCWSMVVQDPPIVLHWPLKQGSDINRDMFNQYTKTGTKLNYEVWPALLLHTNGPILRKGVVQPL
ncbi:uncharacterized protein LOC110459238 isoform X2 [Mizuhopecten yessoensis]|uniref:uncharacterized protein LOC110459238 isoform X2 n=1 Tax=Mizuhopecten yessoensis TaxID=6573 RepID=UPI000B45AF49|nr:uncharacterized protein LOC110459238 isoform X2 [Mizuhopecten yessoensis]